MLVSQDAIPVRVHQDVFATALRRLNFALSGKPDKAHSWKGNCVRTWVVLIALATAFFRVGPIAAVSGSQAHVTGIGGVVVASKNPRRLAAWYREMLGISLEPWGGAMFRYNVPGHPPYTVWSSFSNGAKEFAHSRRDFMLNLSVDNLDALCAHLHTKGVAIYEREATPYGKFASVVDPDGTKIELWEAPKK